MKPEKKATPIIKYNGGIGAILCNKCRVIIKTNLTKEEIEGKTDLLYCNLCSVFSLCLYYGISK